MASQSSPIWYVEMIVGPKLVGLTRALKSRYPIAMVASHSTASCMMIGIPGAIMEAKAAKAMIRAENGHCFKYSERIASA